MTASLPKPIRGIVPPLVTPLIEPDRLDREGGHRLVDHVIDGGVAGVFLLGTCGEGPALGHRLAREWVEWAGEVVADRVPVLVGVSSPSLDDSVEMAEAAADAGASAVVATPPYYYAADDATTREHLRRLARRSPLPVLVYNMPGCTHSHVTPETIRALVDEPNVAGVKDSAGDIATFRPLVAAAAERPDWSLMVGPEHLLGEAVQAGATGGVNGGSNVCPRLFVRWYEALRAGDDAQATRCAQQVGTLGAIYGQPRSAASVIQGLKAALETLGICSGVTTELIGPVSDRLRHTARETLDRLPQELTTLAR